MANLKQIKRRIASVGSTQQITKAMKMVAAAKLRRAQESITLARPYALRLQDVMGRLGIDRDDVSHPLLAEREPKTVCYLVVTADRGLCGGFNSSVIKRTLQALVEAPREQRSVLYCVGKKGVDYFRHHVDVEMVGKMSGVFQELDYSAATSIGHDLCALYESGKIDRVILVFNEFKSAIQQVLHSDQLLPVPLEETEQETLSKVDALFEPDRDSLLATLLPMYVNRLVWRVLLDSYAAEQGARMTAMESATDNAGEMIARLTLQYNRSRQAAITQEISEIVGGAAAIQ